MSLPSDSSPYARWTELSDDDLTVPLIDELLAPIEDDLWVCAACVDRVLDDVDTQRSLLDLAIQRTEKAAISAQEAAEQPEEAVSDEDESSSSHVTPKSRKARIASYFKANNNVAQLCQLRAILLKRLDRLSTFTEIQDSMVLYGDGLEDGGEVIEDWEDDPWADTQDGESVRKPEKSLQARPSPPLPLSIFLTQHLSLMCLALASQMQYDALKVLIYRHWTDVFPFRFEILERFPLFADPAEFYDILPGVNSKTNKELERPHSSRRAALDWVETEDVKVVLTEMGFSVDDDDDDDTAELSSKERLLSEEEISAWYKDRVERILSSTGSADAALSLVQHGVSQGLLGLDELGEDLTLVSRLVYDAPKPLDDDDARLISVSKWRSLNPQEVIRLYLVRSSPETIVADIRRLVLPYLFVLELRAERTGSPEPDLGKRLLYEYVLSADLSMSVPIFDASKPTLVASQRLVSSDEDLARLALACLYGSSSLDEWANMSRIFECLPAWNFGVDEDEEDETDTTVASLSAFLAPSASRPPASSSDLLVFFKPLPSRSLSRALDILDVHLESGELLARWGVPVPLRWFLQSAHDEAQQRAWATKMARQANAPAGDLDSEDIWLSLLEDMLKVCKPGELHTNSAFGALSTTEIKNIFFRGLLSTGRFTIAKNLIRSHDGQQLLSNEELELICLDCSRELYDNANSGNYKFGEMKMAYDCLCVANETPTIRKEKEFIEATSRICSFNVMSRPGVPITPLEIRLTKDKLGLISRVLSSNESAYKHTEVIIDLMRKLGFRNDVLAEVKTLAMITDTALQAEDFDRAFDISERMVTTVLELRQNSPLGTDNPQVADAVEVCWVACFQLGRQSEAENIDKKMFLLGRALELCPPDKIVDILTSWHKLEAEDIDRRKEKAAERASRVGRTANKSNGSRGRAATLASKLQNLHMPSPSLPSAPDAAALASHAFHRVAASFPFSIHGRRAEDSRSRSREGSERRAGSPDVQAQARHALQRGIGWLIGADEDEL